jgi:hypothetical protein
MKDTWRNKKRKERQEVKAPETSFKDRKKDPKEKVDIHIHVHLIIKINFHIPHNLLTDNTCHIHVHGYGQAPRLVHQAYPDSNHHQYEHYFPDDDGTA